MPESNKEKGPSAEFLSSAAHYEDIPESVAREFCVMGRSNVGKSSFINHLFANNGLARVSRTPGKTTFANFYRISDASVWADLPGYGYAERAKSERARWSRLIADYCENRKNLMGVIWLCDLRHPGQTIDKEAYAWFTSLSLPVLAVLTKADKLSRRERDASAKRYTEMFGFPHAPILYSTKGEAARAPCWARYTSWAAEIG